MITNPIIEDIQNLSAKLVSNKNIPADLQGKCLDMLRRAAYATSINGVATTFESTQKYIDFVISLPWQSKSPGILDIHLARDLMDKKHFGLETVKSRIEEYLAALILKEKNGFEFGIKAPSLFFVGLAGTGKTSFASIIAQSLGREFYRIPFGGLSSALDLRGTSRNSEFAAPGAILKAIASCKTRNPVILLDELDRVTPESRAAIMGTLLEILDPSQNVSFSDYYLDFPFDLSEVMFIATANNTREVSTAVLDRLELINMPSYSDEEKIAIGKNYIFGKMLQMSGLAPSDLSINDDVWPKIVRPLGFEPGIRSLERLLSGLTRRVALQKVKGSTAAVIITTDNVSQYIGTTFASVT